MRYFLIIIMLLLTFSVLWAFIGYFIFASTYKRQKIRSNGHTTKSVVNKNSNKKSRFKLHANPYLSEHPRYKEFIDLKKTCSEFIDSLKYVDLNITSHDGLKLCAKYYSAMQSTGKTAILVHGYKSSGLRNFSVIFKDLYENGFDILLVDQRSHQKSEGEYITLGIHESQDCKLWCDKVAELHPENKIYLYGISMGGTTVIMSTYRGLNSNVKAIVADCGFSSPYEISVKISNDMGNGKIFSHYSSFINFITKLLAKFDLKELSTYDAIKDNHIPIFFIHGKTDTFVPYYMSVECYVKCTSKKKLYLCEEGMHGYSYLFDRNTLKNEVLNWFNENE